MALNLQNFIISLIVVSIGVLGFGVYYSGISTSYGVTTTTNITNGGSYNQMLLISNMTDSMYERINNTQPSSQLGGFNILGDFLSYGWNTVKLTFTSYNIFYIILNAAFDDIPGGSGGTMNAIKIAIGSIILIVFVFAIVLFLTGRNQI